MSKIFNMKKEITFSQVILILYIFLIITLSVLYACDIVTSPKLQPL